jgi:predicted dithiol-disulfide oxidoreductase (DUF899 family)
VGDASVSVNYGSAPKDERPVPGISAFLSEGGQVFHTYSTYLHGLDILINTYNLLDITPLGRHEEGLPYGMAWLKHHDEYERTV